MKRPKGDRLRVPNVAPRLASASSLVPVVAPQQTQRIRGRALQGIRRRFLEQDPLCVKCKARGRIVAATQLDHRRPLWDGGSDTADNRQGLCDECHDEKTGAEASLRAGLR